MKHYVNYPKLKISLPGILRMRFLLYNRSITRRSREWVDQNLLQLSELRWGFFAILTNIICVEEDLLKALTLWLHVGGKLQTILLFLVELWLQIFAVW